MTMTRNQVALWFPARFMPLKVSWGNNVTNASSEDPNMALIAERHSPCSPSKGRLNRNLVVFKSTRGQGFGELVRVLLLRSYTLNIDLLGTE